jgi:hypothetical protein
MKQLFECETYLKLRHAQATSGSSVFSTGKGSLPVKAFDGTLALQEQLRTLQKRYESSKLLIAEDLQRQKKEFDALIEEYTNMRCCEDCPTNSDMALRLNSAADAPDCTRCQLKASAEKLKIEIYEKRLPADGFNRKLFAFELSPPRPIVSWRDFACFFCTDVLAKQGDEKKKLIVEEETSLRQYSNHYKLFEAGSDTFYHDCRVVLSSNTQISPERHLQIHMDLQISDVITEHPHTWRYYDTSTGSVIPTQLAPMNIVRSCTVKKPPSATS